VFLDASTVEAVSGGGLARVTEKVGVFGSEARTLDLRVQGRDVQVGESLPRGTAAARRGSLEVMCGSDTVLTGVQLPRFGGRLFLLEAVRPLPVRAELGGSSLEPAVTLANDSSLMLSGGFLSLGGKLYPLGDVPPGFRGQRKLAAALQQTEAIPDAERLSFWEQAGGRFSGPVLYAWLERPLLAAEAPRGARLIAGPSLHLLALEVQ
jgi:hypothetical protein